ncbi:MAG TPA: 16S rRNA (guanine(966)-N(2))-methyltransferase RsmD [Thermoanaerobaculia bacterium]|nr:16S rRNA (guanine(966)-N(2))-methyltransferase RsmD [Thermoanaerobaculia bacterium]
MTGLRVTAGTLRGRRIPVPPHAVRPTSERARQAYFNIIGERIDGARFLDLFAGSGIFSFEAVSRGAATAVAIEYSRHNAEAIERIAVNWNAPVRTINADIFAGIKRLDTAVFDLVYADPPYEYERYDELLLAIDNRVPLAGNALAVIEHKRRSEPFRKKPGGLQFVRRAEYGEVWMSFFERTEVSS